MFQKIKFVGITNIFRKKVQIKSVSLKSLRTGLVKYLKYTMEEKFKNCSNSCSYSNFST